MSRIEQLIDEIEEFVDGCKTQPFSQNKVIVPKDELFELLTELRLKTPDEIKRYQKIIANKDKIINDAQAQAERMLAETEAYTNQLVEEHQIMLKAYERAEEVLNSANAQAEATIAEANANAEEIRQGALQYTKDLVDNLENIVANALAISKEHSTGLITGLTSSLNILQENQEALESQIGQTTTSEAPVVAASDDDIDFEDDDDFEDEDDIEEDDVDFDDEDEDEEEEEEIDDDDDDDDDDDFDYDDID